MDNIHKVISKYTGLKVSQKLDSPTTVLPYLIKSENIDAKMKDKLENIISHSVISSLAYVEHIKKPFKKGEKVLLEDPEAIFDYIYVLHRYGHDVSSYERVLFDLPPCNQHLRYAISITKKRLPIEIENSFDFSKSMGLVRMYVVGIPESIKNKKIANTIPIETISVYYESHGNINGILDIARRDAEAAYQFLKMNGIIEEEEEEEKFEKVILQDAEYSLGYAKRILKDTFPAFEKKHLLKIENIHNASDYLGHCMKLNKRASSELEQFIIGVYENQQSDLSSSDIYYIKKYIDTYLK
jgi:hypothetical protein